MVFRMYFHRKSLRYYANLLAYSKRMLSYIFKKQVRYLFIKRIENLEVETIHTATNTPETFNLPTCTAEYRMQKRN